MKAIVRTARPVFVVALLGLFAAAESPSQFLADFRSKTLTIDPRGEHGWSFFTGGGTATMDFRQGAACASITVDATHDQRGIWWALIKRMVSDKLDLSRLRQPRHELRIEARVRVSDAPKRVNLSLNTQRTTDFHTNLMEFDIPDTTGWHTISMTTDGFDAVPGDSVYAQLALMDWGFDRCRVDLQYFRVDIVNTDSLPPDLGAAVPYHPPSKEPAAFANHRTAVEGATIDLQYPDMNFGGWSAIGDSESTRILTVSPTQFVILRWDLAPFAGQKVVGAGELEITTYSQQRLVGQQKDFGMVRVCEIFGGDRLWTARDVTYNSLCSGLPLPRVINSQMIVDVEVTRGRDGRNLIVLSRPVMQRLIDGQTLGLAIKPLGAIIASFHDGASGIMPFPPTLHFNCGANEQRESAKER